MLETSWDATYLADFGPIIFALTLIFVAEGWLLRRDLGAYSRQSYEARRRAAGAVVWIPVGLFVAALSVLVGFLGLHWSFDLLIDKGFSERIELSFLSLGLVFLLLLLVPWILVSEEKIQRMARRLAPWIHRLMRAGDDTTGTAASRSCWADRALLGIALSGYLLLLAVVADSIWIDLLLAGCLLYQRLSFRKWQLAMLDARAEG